MSVSVWRAVSDRSEAAPPVAEAADGDPGARRGGGFRVRAVSAAVRGGAVQCHLRDLYGGCGIFIPHGAQGGQAVRVFQTEPAAAVSGPALLSDPDGGVYHAAAVSAACRACEMVR